MAHLYYVVCTTCYNTTNKFCTNYTARILSLKQRLPNVIHIAMAPYILICPILPKFGKIPKKAYFAIRYLFKNFSEEKQKHKELKSSIKKALKN